MQVIFYLLLILLLAFGGFIIYLAYNIYHDNNNVLPLLTGLVKVGLLIYIIASVIITIAVLFYINDELVITSMIIKQIIVTLYFIVIYKLSSKLLENLSSDVIFDDENVQLTKQLGLQFLYLSITEIVIGILFGIIVFSSVGTFNIATNNTIFVYVVIGLVLQIVALILKKATRIYEENKLTI